MATTKEILHTIRIQGNNGNFGALAVRDFARQLTFEQIVERTIDITSTTLDEEVDLTGFAGGEATFVFIRVALNAIQVKFNDIGANSFTIPTDGMVLISGQGVEKLFLSGQPAGDARILVVAAGN